MTGNWRPISSAPTDGRTILVCGGTFTWDSNAYDCEECKCDFVTLVNWCSKLGTSGWCGDKTEDGYYWYKPKYWMDIPEPKRD